MSEDLFTDEELTKMVDRLNAVLDYATSTGEDGAVLGSHLVTLFLSEEGFEAWKNHDKACVPHVERAVERALALGVAVDG